jgi:hypothetical protein
MLHQKGYRKNRGKLSHIKFKVPNYFHIRSNWRIYIPNMEAHKNASNILRQFGANCHVVQSTHHLLGMFKIMVLGISQEL